MAMLTALGALYSWRVEPYWLDVTQVTMPIKNLPQHWQGKTLMQISDIHVGNGFDADFLKRSFKEAEKYHPDIVVYTGDFVTWHNQTQLRELNDVLTHGTKGRLATAGILGNHDYGVNWRQNHVADAVTTVAEANGISILNNQQIDINGLVLTGFEDFWSTRFDETLMKHYNPAAANIVLCHNPDACDKPIWNNYTGWILAGHTHGGQIKAPFIDAPVIPVNNKKYTSGKINLADGRTLYINRGLSTSHYVRFNVRPEITIFTLTQNTSA